MENNSETSWEMKYYEVQQKFDNAQKEVARLNQQIVNQSPSAKKIEHPGTFWVKLRKELVHDLDTIKQLVRSKKLTMFDSDHVGKTLLHHAAERGAYETAQFCLNQGADINAKMKHGHTPLHYAKTCGYYNIEQLLLFATMNVGIGNEVKNMATTIHKQNGIIQNMLSALEQIGQQSKQLFEKLLVELMINMMNQRLSFDDILLNLCYDIDSSELWKSIASTCSDIVRNGNKRDWHWLKTYVLPSTLWYRKEKGSSNYLYYNLLKIVNLEAVRQVNKLETDLTILANEHADDWDKLTVWHISHQPSVVRQDLIPAGIASRYTYNQLSEGSGSTFHAPQFYDYNQYLSQLILLAQLVDDEFQESVQEMYHIDKVTNIANLSADDMKENIILYQRGPVKRIERARAKAQTDYADEAYPASACVVDINRCALIFNDISTMLKALQLFVNKVKYYQSGNIIDIIRDKNGFVEYVKQPQYADIKLNVLIKGKHNNIIGEVQFLLNTMDIFKAKAHNLYSIQRIEESIESSVSKVLPLLLDEDKQIFSAANRGSVRELCDIMVTFNKSINDLMMNKDEQQNTILHSICKLRHIKAFKFLYEMAAKEDFIKHAFVLDRKSLSPINHSVRQGLTHISRLFFSIKEIQQVFMESKDERYRIIIDLLGMTPYDSPLPQYIFDLLKISHDEVKELMHYKYEKRMKSDSYYITVVPQTFLSSTAKELQRLVSLLGEKAFLEGALMYGRCGNAIEEAVRQNKLESIQYVMGLDAVKERYLNDVTLLNSLFERLNKYNSSHEMVLFIIQKLEVSQSKLYEMQKNQGLNIENFLAILKN